MYSNRLEENLAQLNAEHVNVLVGVSGFSSNFTSTDYTHPHLRTCERLPLLLRVERIGHGTATT